ncbi:MAG: hypothetical protein ACYTGG_03780 [Planctomycetota bacterium]
MAEHDAHDPRWSVSPRLTLLAGFVIIIVTEVLMFLDVVRRGGAVMPREPLPDPAGWLGSIARAAAVNATPLCWIGFLLVLDGLLSLVRGRGSDDAGSPIRRRPGLFILCFVTSVPVWCFFDWVNFSFLDAWRYHGLPEQMIHRLSGYFFAFGAITPALLLTAELYRRLGLDGWRMRPVDIGPRGRGVIVGLGVVCLAIPFIVQRPAGCIPLWLGVALLLDPVNDRLGAASLLGDWRAGRSGRTAALLAAGATCGLLWEFWNYWAAAKWTYNLPFLGPVESVRLYEMPLPGYTGFLPFALECWVAFQSIRLVAQRVSGGRWRVAADDGSAL